MGFVRSLAAAVSGNAPSGTNFFNAVVKDLQASRGKSIVIAGEDQSPALVHHPGGGARAEERSREVHLEHVAPDRRLGLERTRNNR